MSAEQAIGVGAVARIPNFCGLAPATTPGLLVQMRNKLKTRRGRRG